MSSAHRTAGKGRIEHTRAVPNDPSAPRTRQNGLTDFDQSLPFDIDLEYNFGTTRMQDTAEQNVWEFSFQWALQRDFFSKDFALFIHGFYNAARLPRVPRPTQPVSLYGDFRQNAVGAGFLWTVNRRLALYG